MNAWLIFIISVILISFLLDIVVDYLNLTNFQRELPAEFAGIYDPERYQTSQQYQRENTCFSLIQHSIGTPLTLAFLLLGGFNYVDLWARHWGCGPIITGIIFAFSLGFISQLLSLPFSLYHTFVIEEKYGFNKTTIKTYGVDLLKGWLLSLMIGAPVFALIILFFSSAGSWSWVYVWLFITVVQLILTFLAPVLIMPIFNKFTPLPEGELKDAIESYARGENFKLQGIYTMDGSKRSTKSNAFFTGFGKYRRIVLFDTLIANHSVDQLVAILAHEMGHFKLKHIHKLIFISILTMGLTLYLLSLMLNNPGVFAAFKMEHISVYASIVFFGFLYAPVSLLLSILINHLSRKFEYQADAYAACTHGQPDAMINALKKLSVDNLTNLTPHPLKVFLEYSHPPVLARIQAIRAIAPYIPTPRIN